jgi:hypothetical protein
MGCCCSCLGKDNAEQTASSSGGAAAAQTEMTDRAFEVVLVSRGMTAPTIDVLESGSAVRKPANDTKIA